MSRHRKGQMASKVHLLLSNSVEDMAIALDRVDLLLNKAGADEQIAFRIRLALEELITNSIMHGYPEGGAHEIGIELAIEPERVAVEITDDGVPFDPFRPREAVLTGSVEERPIGGLGLHLIKQLIPELSYRRARGRNIVGLASPLQHTAPTGD
ncbi:MAG TPA: ATP-binding protein [Devosiaceae bacterium]|nr:ATP-binding protein [Devosiaceae bacterium]